MKRGCLLRLEARLHEMRLLASFEGLVYVKRGVGIFRGPDCAKQGCWR